MSARGLAARGGERLAARGGARLAGLAARPAGREIVVRALPAALGRRFDPARASGLEAVFALRVRAGAGRAFTIRITAGTCAVTPGAPTGPGATVELGADDAVRLVTGAAGWPELLSSHRLALSGDPFLALRFPQLFRLPADGA